MREGVALFSREPRWPGGRNAPRKTPLVNSLSLPSFLTWPWQQSPTQKERNWPLRRLGSGFSRPATSLELRPALQQNLNPTVLLATRAGQIFRPREVFAKARRAQSSRVEAIPNQGLQNR